MDTIQVEVLQLWKNGAGLWLVAVFWSQESNVVKMTGLKMSGIADVVVASPKAQRLEDLCARMPDARVNELKGDIHGRPSIRKNRQVSPPRNMRKKDR